MGQNRLFRLPIDPDSVEDVREHFDSLEQRRDTFERGLALEGMNAETAWLDETEPALYYLHDESDQFPADIDQGDIDDEELLELSAEHSRFFSEVAPAEHDGREDLEEIEPLFHASARDRVE